MNALRRAPSGSRRRTTYRSLALFALLAAASASESFALEWLFGKKDPPGTFQSGTVRDANSNKPIPEVWVISKWESIPAGAHFPSACAVEVVRTDDRGRFAIKSGELLMGKRPGERATHVNFFYAPGFTQPRQTRVGTPGDVIELVPETRSTNARLMELHRIAAGIECQEYLETRKAIVWPIYKALNDEAILIAKTPQQRIAAVSVKRWIHVLQSGYEAANRATIAEREKLDDFSLK